MSTNDSISASATSPNVDAHEIGDRDIGDRDVFDAAVIGAGPAGLTTTAALAHAGIKVICLDRQFGFHGETKGDTRTIALLQGSIQLLKNLNIWPHCVNYAAPLDVMRVIDDTGRFPRAPDMTFKASELGPEPFGYNIPNDRLTSALALHAERHPNITLHTTSAVEKVIGGPREVILTTAEKQQIRCALVVGADGPESIARRSARIETVDWRYDQIAIAGWFSHSRPHRNISTEFHRPAGPLGRRADAGQSLRIGVGGTSFHGKAHHGAR